VSPHSGICDMVASETRALRTKQRRLTNAFVYRAGIGVVGTHVTCDAAGFPSDLIFISHAHALGPGGPARLAGQRAGRRQILATEQTLRLLGDAGEKLRSRTLPAAFGRPFNLGGQRIEIVPTAYLPGAASLLCEIEHRRVFYLGAFAAESLLPGLSAEIRHADAICMDATFGQPGLRFPPRRQTLAGVRAFVQDTIAEGKIAVLLASVSALPMLAADLAQAKIPLRAHQRLAAELARLHGVCDAIPTAARASRKPTVGEALLWPCDARNITAARALPGARVALVSGSAVHADVLDRMKVDCGFPLTNLPTRDEILSAIEASGAREVALFPSGAEDLANELNGRGFHAYTLGPPRQMTLVA
jgi:putative mRNA 3-end processing factor